MSAISERSLTSEELSEFAAYSRKGMQLLGISEALAPAYVVKAVDTYIGSWQSKRRGLLSRIRSPSGDPVEQSLALGIVWGNQIVRRFQWSWVCVLIDGEERYGVVSPDRSLVIYATYFVKECLDHSTADCTVMLAFNMQAAGTLAHEAPNQYASVMRSVRRIIPNS
jgi:hypothetical protein